MESLITSKEKIHIDINDEVTSFTLKLGTVVTALIGIWAFSCLVAGLFSVGTNDMLLGYISAITGF